MPGASVSGGPASGVARGRATAPYGALAASGAAPIVNLPSGDVEPPTHSPTATGKAAVPTTPTAAGQPTASSGAIAPTSPPSTSAPSGHGQISTEPIDKTTFTVPSRTDGAGGPASDAKMPPPSTAAPESGGHTTFFTLPHPPEGPARVGDGPPAAAGGTAATSAETTPDETAPGDSEPERADSAEHTTFFTLPHRPENAATGDETVGPGTTPNDTAVPDDGPPAAGEAVATGTETTPDDTAAPGDSKPERADSAEHTTFFTLPRKPGATPEPSRSDLTSGTEPPQADGGESTSSTVGRTAPEAETVRAETASAEVPQSDADLAGDAAAGKTKAARGSGETAAGETDVTPGTDANAAETDVTPASDVAAAEANETATAPGADAATADDGDATEPTAATVPGSRKPEPDQKTGGRRSAATTRTTGRGGKLARGRRSKTGSATGQVPSQAGPDQTDDSSTTAEDGAQDATAPRVPTARTPESSTSSTPAEAEPS